MIYAVCYNHNNDIYMLGYFLNLKEAEKYCALQNAEDDDNGGYYKDDFFIKPLKSLKNISDLSNVELIYEHRIVFDIKENGVELRHEDHQDYTYYIADHVRYDWISDRHMKDGWISVIVNTDSNDRSVAEDIAQGYIDELLACAPNKDCILNSAILGMNLEFINKAAKSLYKLD